MNKRYIVTGLFMLLSAACFAESANQKTIPIGEPDYNTATATELQRYTSLLNLYRENEKAKADIYKIWKPERDSGDIRPFTLQPGFSQDFLAADAAPAESPVENDKPVSPGSTLISIIGGEIVVRQGGIDHRLKVGDEFLGWRLVSLLDDRSVRFARGDRKKQLTLGVAGTL